MTKEAPEPQRSRVSSSFLRFPSLFLIYFFPSSFQLNLVACGVWRPLMMELSGLWSFDKLALVAASTACHYWFVPAMEQVEELLGWKVCAVSAVGEDGSCSGAAAAVDDLADDESATGRVGRTPTDVSSDGDPYEPAGSGFEEESHEGEEQEHEQEQEADVADDANDADDLNVDTQIPSSPSSARADSDLYIFYNPAVYLCLSLALGLTITAITIRGFGQVKSWQVFWRAGMESRLFLSLCFNFFSSLVLASFDRILYSFTGVIREEDRDSATGVIIGWLAFRFLMMETVRAATEKELLGAGDSDSDSDSDGHAVFLDSLALYSVVFAYLSLVKMLSQTCACRVRRDRLSGAAPSPRDSVTGLMRFTLLLLYLGSLAFIYLGERSLMGFEGLYSMAIIYLEVIKGWVTHRGTIRENDGLAAMGLASREAGGEERCDDIHRKMSKACQATERFRRYFNLSIQFVQLKSYIHMWHCLGFNYTFFDAVIALAIRGCIHDAGCVLRDWALDNRVMKEIDKGEKIYIILFFFLFFFIFRSPPCSQKALFFFLFFSLSPFSVLEPNGFRAVRASVRERDMLRLPEAFR